MAGLPVTKRRDIWGEFSPGTTIVTDYGFNPPRTTTFRTQHLPVKGTQVTVSEGHPYHSRKRGDKADLGGDFYSQKIHVEGTKSRSTVKWPKNLNQRSGTYSGPCFPVDPRLQTYPPSNELSNAQIDALGATAVARCKPTNSVANAAVFLGELHRDGLPIIPGVSTWKDRTSACRKAGGEFLNVEFGWKPLVSDVRSFATAVSTAHTVLRQYERDAGKVVRRTYGFPLEVVNSAPITGISGTFMDPLNSDTKALPTTKYEIQRTVIRRKWFSGAFTYALPTGSDSRSKMARYARYADKLLGISPTPDALWNLAPWSWAIDWFSNTGDVVSNISDWATDGLVMQYGYQMVHTITRDNYVPLGSDLIDGSFSRPFTMVVETKQRRKANPFGFSLSWNGLSPVQQAIALAIGLTR